MDEELYQSGVWHVPVTKSYFSFPPQGKNQKKDGVTMRKTLVFIRLRLSEKLIR